jgi:hypothetical protein
MKCGKLKIMCDDSEKDVGDKDFMIKINLLMMILVMMKAVMRKIMMSRKKMGMMWPMTNRYNDDGDNATDGKDW